MLEEGSFRGRTADFLWMLILGGVVMTVRVSSHFHLESMRVYN